MNRLARIHNERMDFYLRKWRLRPASQIWKQFRPFNLRWSYHRFSSTITRDVSQPSATTHKQGIQLRQYQEECIQSILDHIRRGHKRLGVSLATGSGKTVSDCKSHLFIVINFTDVILLLGHLYKAYWPRPPSEWWSSYPFNHYRSSKRTCRTGGSTLFVSLSRQNCRDWDGQ